MVIASTRPADVPGNEGDIFFSVHVNWQTKYERTHDKAGQRRPRSEYVIGTKVFLGLEREGNH